MVGPGFGFFVGNNRKPLLDPVPTRLLPDTPEFQVKSSAGAGRYHERVRPHEVFGVRRIESESPADFEELALELEDSLHLEETPIRTRACEVEQLALDPLAQRKRTAA